MMFSNVFLESGQRDKAEKCYNQIRIIYERTKQGYTLITAMAADGNIAIFDGRFEEALEIAKSIEAKGMEFNISAFANAWVITVTNLPFLYLGRFNEISPSMIFPSNLFRIISQGKPGSNQEASELLQKLVVERPGIGTDQDDTPGTIDILYLQVAILIGHQASTELLLRRFSDCGLLTVNRMCLPRTLGGAAALLEKYDEAREFYKQSFKICTELNMRPELALTHLNFAELLLDHYPKEKAEAIEHLDFAIKEFREMKMQPSLERALRRKEILKA